MRLVLCALLLTVSLATADSKQDIADSIALYVKSIDAADGAMAARVWSDGPDVTFIHPLGEEHGLPQIREDVYRKLMGETFSKRRLTVRDVAIHVNGKIAWAEFNWDFEATARKDGSAVKSAGRETQIYRREKNGWRIVHVHYSAMPAGAQ